MELFSQNKNDLNINNVVYLQFFPQRMLEKVWLSVSFMKRNIDDI